MYISLQDHVLSCTHNTCIYRCQYHCDLFIVYLGHLGTWLWPSGKLRFDCQKIDKSYHFLPVILQRGLIGRIYTGRQKKGINGGYISTTFEMSICTTQNKYGKSSPWYVCTRLFAFFDGLNWLLNRKVYTIFKLVQLPIHL